MIIKIKKETNYSIISNDPLHDINLSYGARGLLAYLLTLPSDWELNMPYLVSKSKKDGRDKVSSLFSELMELGYAERTENRVKGQFKGYDYTIFEKPRTGNAETANRINSMQPKTEKAETAKPITANPLQLSTILKEQNTNNTNNLIEGAVFSKNDHASEIDSLRNEIEELKSLIKQQKNKVQAEGAKCNNVANNELAVLSASIGTSYTKAQESKDKPLKATKTAKSAKISIDSQIEFQCYENFAKYWAEKLESKYPEIDCEKCYDWFLLTVKSKYDLQYSDYRLVLQKWLNAGKAAKGDWRASEYASILKNKPTEQYNNEGLINEMLQRTAGKPTTMDKINAKALEVFERYMNEQNNK